MTPGALGVYCFRGRADAHMLDIAPTVLELLGIEAPPKMRGRSLLPLLAAR